MIYIMRPCLKNNNKNKTKKPKTSALIAKENMSQSLGTTIGLLCPHENLYFCEPKGSPCIATLALNSQAWETLLPWLPEQLGP